MFAWILAVSLLCPLASLTALPSILTTYPYCVAAMLPNSTTDMRFGLNGETRSTASGSTVNLMDLAEDYTGALALDHDDLERVSQTSEPLPVTGEVDLPSEFFIGDHDSDPNRTPIPGSPEPDYVSSLGSQPYVAIPNVARTTSITEGSLRQNGIDNNIIRNTVFRNQKHSGIKMPWETGMAAPIFNSSSYTMWPFVDLPHWTF